MRAAIELDCRELRCPLPVIELAKVAQREHGVDVVVVTADPAARTDIPAWCRLRGQEYAGEETADDGVPAYRVRLLPQSEPGPA
ncbi:MAG: sulfurtransferase TusA family protein [Nocardioides sp.]